MSTSTMAEALAAIDDPAVRGVVASGDLSPLAGVDLSIEEQALIVGAAADYPEVEGFSFATVRQPSFPDVVRQPSPPSGPVPIPYPNRYQAAVDYLGR